MRETRYVLKKKYETKRALLIGINDYQKASPLGYAVSDANGVKEVLIDDLQFKEEDITVLLDAQATKSNIMKNFMRFSDEDVSVDDCLFVFFAGHGYTKLGFKGEVGYLVPHDADMDDLSTFIRWDDLTRNAELIRAKHILFIMDACYGGLAVHRELKPGSSRFLFDMFQRFSRQVLTAGKPDQIVADSGGPLPGHSIFTGHLIEGLRGSAGNEYGVITANSLFAYVYSKVSNDINSEQTPHYGQFDGDGDFIISVPEQDSETDENIDNDKLITLPSFEEVRTEKTTMEKISYVKELLTSRKTITLHDFVVEEVQQFLAETYNQQFDVRSDVTAEKIQERINLHEEKTKDLAYIAACLAYWCDSADLKILSKMISRVSDPPMEPQGGLVVLIELKKYPLVYLLYMIGIAAVEAKRYQVLFHVFNTELSIHESSGNGSSFIIQTATAITSLFNAFKAIPEYSAKYTPVSEHLYKAIQPGIDKLFFTGKAYEALFDEFEILFALTVIDLKSKTEDSHVWAPVGRFGWKRRYGSNSPLNKLLDEAERLRDEWGPLQAGFFGGSYARFTEVVELFKDRVLNQLRWF